MAYFIKKNNVKSTVADNPLSAGATTLNVAAGQGSRFPSTFPFLITVWDKTTYSDPSDDTNMEIMICTARTTDALTVTRAQEGTTGVSHALGSAVEMLITAGIFNNSTYGIEGIVDTHEADTTSIHGITDTSKIATLDTTQTFTAIKTFTDDLDLISQSGTGVGSRLQLKPAHEDGYCQIYFYPEQGANQDMGIVVHKELSGTETLHRHMTIYASEALGAAPYAKVILDYGTPDPEFLLSRCHLNFDTSAAPPPSGSGGYCQTLVMNNNSSVSWWNKDLTTLVNIVKMNWANNVHIGQATYNKDIVFETGAASEVGRFTSDGTAQASLVVNDNGGASGVLALHSDDAGAYMIVMYNNTYGPTSPTGQMYVDNSGNFLIGNADNKNLVFYNNTYANPRATIDTSGNILLGNQSAGTSGQKVLVIANGTPPTTSPADEIQLYSVDISAGNASLGLRTEKAVVTDAALSSTHSLTVKINGSNYKIPLVSA